MDSFLSRIRQAPRLQRLSYRCAIVLYLLILLLGSTPGAREDIGEYASGVVLHLAAYTALTVLLFVGSSGMRTGRAVKSMLTIAAMGALDEYVQSFFPYRTASVTDWMVDLAAGAFASTLLWKLWTTGNSS
jgi:VanZ family protein